MEEPIENIAQPAVKKVNITTSIARELFNFALIVILVILPIRIFVAQPFIVVGTSMEPTFVNNEYLIVDELTYRLSEPHRGDVIVFKFDNNPSKSTDSGTVTNPSKYFIKRLIGLPGETIDIRDGKVTIVNDKNPAGFVLNETYIKDLPTNTMTVTLEKGKYFVMGDNREVSYDSRSWGQLDGHKIVGKVFVRLLPPQKIGIFPGSFAGDYSNEKN